MDQQQEPDEYWMRCLVDGQQEALAVLVRRYANPLLTFIERMVGDRHRAEEVFQEVFLAVWTHRRRFDRTRRFRCWLFGIAANKCRAQCRRQAWRELLTGDAADCPPAAPDPSWPINSPAAIICPAGPPSSRKARWPSK